MLQRRGASIGTVTGVAAMSVIFNVIACCCDSDGSVLVGCMWQESSRDRLLAMLSGMGRASRIPLGGQTSGLAIPVAFGKTHIESFVYTLACARVKNKRF